MQTDRTRELATIPGRPPAVGETPAGCPFAARCAFATEICREQRPDLVVRSDGHRVACWHPQELVPAGAVQAGPDAEVAGLPGARR
jgi:ABC-type dipeptide/oligopeptide/nickel transport system ATPase component